MKSGYCFTFLYFKLTTNHLVFSELANNWFMQKKANVLEHVEGP